MTKSTSIKDNKTDSRYSNPLKSDVSSISKTDIPSRLYIYEEGQINKSIEAIKVRYNLLDNKMKSESFVSYNISNYVKEFPYEIYNDEVISYLDCNNKSLFFMISIHIEGIEHPTQVEIYLNEHYNRVEILDEEVFKNTVLKLLIIGTEKIKMDQEMGHGVLRKLGIGLDYNKATKTADFNKMKENMMTTYDFLIDKNYSEEMLNKYSGHYDLYIDVMSVKKGQVQLGKIIDDVIIQVL